MSFINYQDDSDNNEGNYCNELKTECIIDIPEVATVTDTRSDLETISSELGNINDEPIETVYHGRYIPDNMHRRKVSKLPVAKLERMNTMQQLQDTVNDGDGETTNAVKINETLNMVYKLYDDLGNQLEWVTTQTREIANESEKDRRIAAEERKIDRRWNWFFQFVGLALGVIFFFIGLVYATILFVLEMGFVF